MADITVIVPIYNVEKYVEKCLKSLINQSYTNFEVWAVNDGSPDNSKQIVKKYEKIDSRIKLISQKNGGYGSVLENCIKNINTKYFIICDPDDWLEENALEVLYKTAEKENLDLVVGDKYEVYSDNDEINYKSSLEDSIHLKPNTVYTSIRDIQLFSFLLVSPHAKLYKTAISKKIKFPRHVSYTDYILYLLSLAEAKRVEYINKPLAFYLIDRPGNTTTDSNPKIILYLIKVWNSAYKQLSNYNNVDILWWRMYAELELILSKYASISMNKKEMNFYMNEIEAMVYRLMKYRKNIKKVAPNNIKFRLFFYGVTNKFTCKIFIHLYIKLKQKNFHRRNV